MSIEAMNWVWKHSPYSGTKLLIHLAIADVVNDLHDNTFWASNDTLADKCNCTRQTVNTTLAQFVINGHLNVVRKATGREQTVKYEFVMPESVKSTEESVKSFTSVEEESVKSTEESVGKFDTIPKNTKTQDTQEEPNDQLELLDEFPKAQPQHIVDRNKVWEAYIGSLKEFDPNKKLFPKLDNKRRQLIERRLKDYSVDDLVLAVTGWLNSDFHRGNNDDGKVWNSIDLFLRNSEKIEMFIAHANKKTTKRAKLGESWDESATGLTITRIKPEDFLE